MSPSAVSSFFSEKRSADLVEARLEGADAGRLGGFVVQAARHLHMLAKDMQPTVAEWRAALEFLTEVGHATDDRRQEWVLLSDLLGLSALVEEINAKRPEGATPNGMRGPFYRADAPELPLGADISLDGRGHALVIAGRVLDLDGRPVPHAAVETWQANGDGFYENQQPDLQPEFNLRGVFVTDAQGAFHYRTVRPGGYRVPDDGPVGRLMAGLGVPLRRPAHLHFRISADGFETITTQLYDRADPDMARDPVFGVKQPLVVDIAKRDDGAFSLRYDFVMVRARRESRAV